MSDRSLEPGQPAERDPACSHPWLRIVCGECGQPVDMLGLEVIRPPLTSVDLPAATGEPGEPRETGAAQLADARDPIFVVARGHPELVEQLRAVMGQSANIQVIEDRRRGPRSPVSPGDLASAGRVELRKRVREDADPSPGGDPPPPSQA